MLPVCGCQSKRSQQSGGVFSLPCDRGLLPILGSPRRRPSLKANTYSYPTALATNSRIQWTALRGCLSPKRPTVAITAALGVRLLQAERPASNTWWARGESNPNSSRRGLACAGAPNRPVKFLLTSRIADVLCSQAESALGCSRSHKGGNSDRPCRGHAWLAAAGFSPSRRWLAALRSAL